MRKSGLTAATLLVAATLPFAVATDALAQSKAGAAGPAGPAPAAAAPSVSSMPAGPLGGGGGMRGGGAVGGGAVRGGGGAPIAGGLPAGPYPPVASGGSKGGVVGVAPAPGRQAWSGSRPGWNGGYHRHRHHHHRHFHPGIGFSTGLLLGGAYAASPYYYDEPYSYDYPYDDGYVVRAAPAAPDEVAYCRQRYRSYDVRTGTYLNNDGNRYPCP